MTNIKWPVVISGGDQESTQFVVVRMDRKGQARVYPLRSAGKRKITIPIRHGGSQGVFREERANPKRLAS